MKTSDIQLHVVKKNPHHNVQDPIVKHILHFCSNQPIEYMLQWKIRPASVLKKNTCICTLQSLLIEIKNDNLPQVHEILIYRSHILWHYSYTSQQENGSFAMIWSKLDEKKTYRTISVFTQIEEIHFCSYVTGGHVGPGNIWQGAKSWS
jgi:hypothetical protein